MKQRLLFFTLLAILLEIWNLQAQLLTTPLSVPSTNGVLGSVLAIKNDKPGCP